jgi:parvulin-like peptidyl-prolyl isomerase
MRNLLFAVLVLAAACKQNKSKLDDMPASKTASPGAAAKSTDSAIDIDSKDILNREESFDQVEVKHVLIGWSDLDKVYQGRMDPRAQKRSNAEAAKLAQEIAGKLRKAPDSLDAVVKEHSEDPGSLSGDAYTVRADAPFVPEFKSLGLRLKEKEVGIVKTRFGYHVMMRVPPPPPDPLESADVLARQAKPGTAIVQHVVIGWKDTQAARSGRGDERSKDREKAAADTLAQEVLAKVKGGADMKALMKEYSEDPGSKDTGRSIDFSEGSPVPAPFENLKNAALRLEVGEAAMVKSPMGWHIMKRVPPPPPDSLESTDILKREPVTQKAKVKHILLNWKDNNGGGEDERAKKRDRAALEKLVKDTMARLKKGDKIEPLMASLSEDPGSAKSGEGYDVTPDAGLVEPFKQLSLRLNVNEVGAVKTEFGIHIIQRVE